MLEGLGDMSEQLRESLSAAMDGEADAFELRRVLDEAKQDEALREQWHRLHLLRDVLREDLKVYQPDLRERIWHGLLERAEEQDQEIELVLAETAQTNRSQRSPWLGRLVATGVAAVVAVVVVFNGGVFEQGLDGDVPVDFAADSTYPNVDFQTPQAVAAEEPVMYQQATALDHQRQNAWMLHHIQQRAMNQAGVASFVKMATFNSTRIVPVSTSEAAEDRRAP